MGAERPRESQTERELREREEEMLRDHDRPSEEANERNMPPFEEIVGDDDSDDDQP